MSWFRKKKVEDWKLVRTVEASFTWTDRNNEKDDVVYYLYESNLGNRRCEYKATGLADTYDKAPTHPTYIKSVYPWTKGMNLKDTPTYWDVAKDKQEEYIQELYRRILKFKNLYETR